MPLGVLALSVWSSVVASAGETSEALPVAPPPAASDARLPSRGTVPLVFGGILTGLGGFNLVTIPLVTTDAYHEIIEEGYLLTPEEADTVCNVIIGVAAVQAAVQLGIGIPLLVKGTRLKRERAAWDAAHGVSEVRFSVTPAGMAVAGRF